MFHGRKLRVPFVINDFTHRFPLIVDGVARLRSRRLELSAHYSSLNPLRFT
jgi:hypothetical protein